MITQQLNFIYTSNKLSKDELKSIKGGFPPLIGNPNCFECHRAPVGDVYCFSEFEPHQLCMDQYPSSLGVYHWAPCDRDCSIHY